MSLQQTQLAPGRTRFSSARGSIELWRPVPRVIVIRPAGHVDWEIMAPIFVAVDDCIREARSQKIIEFYDTWDTGSYDSKVRVASSHWLHANKQHIEHVHVLVRSHLVAMAITIMSKMHQGLFVSYSNRAEFDATVGATLRRLRGFGKPF